ncbi:hypothetical protein [Nocardia sp. NPDC050435]|uniref:hypothetical protein n=1 Tax=Nocardia sp. NPDC050435 TaxID=3155040 RepID=UPI003407AAEF
MLGPGHRGHWLEPDREYPGGLVEARHCEHCRPGPGVAVADIDCAVCASADSPLLVGHFAEELATTGEVPALVARLLAVRSWRAVSRVGMVCPDHPPADRRPHNHHDMSQGGA